MPKDSGSALDRRIGRNIRFHRTRQHLSMVRLAQMIGVTFQQLQKYERGSNRIAASRLYKVSHALQVAMASFFEEPSPMPAPSMRLSSGKRGHMNAGGGG